MKTLFLVFLFSSIFSSLWAAESKGSHGNVTDLISPFINFLIFIGVLYWALKGKVKAYFSNLGKTVAANYSKAQGNKREAEVKFKSYQEKLNGLKSRREEFMNRNKKEIFLFEDDYKQEVQKKIQKFQEDGNAMVSAEKAALSNELTKELLEDILKRVENSFQGEMLLREKAAKNLMKGISL